MPLSLLALEAGKDVFCEKPTLTIAEGRTLVDAVKRHNAVFQAGIEDRSIIYYHKMAELARNAALGTLRTIHVTLPAGTALPIEQPVPPPADFNWNLWLGPAPFRPYTPTITEPMNWRQIRDFSGGLLTDWGAHLLDTAQVAVSAELSGPVDVEGKGELPKNSMFNDVRQVQGPLPLCRRRRAAGRVGRHLNPHRGHGRLGEQQELACPVRGQFAGSAAAEVQSEDQQALAAAAVRASQLPGLREVAPADDLHRRGAQRLATVLHIGNIAMTLGRKLKWDPASESFPGDDEANALRAGPRATIGRMPDGQLPRNNTHEGTPSFQQTSRQSLGGGKVPF